jgi:CRP/FNR family transcriptional regulator, polysaccharide utilization system transcription regulator
LCAYTAKDISAKMKANSLFCDKIKSSGKKSKNLGSFFRIEGIEKYIDPKQKFSLKKGEALFSENEFADSLYLLREGKIKVIKSDQYDHPHLISFAKPGDILGLHSVVHNKNYNASAIAIEKSNGFYIEKNVFQNFLDQNKDSIINIMKCLCKDLDDIEKKIISLQFMTLPERLLDGFKQLYKTYGADKNDFLEIRLSDIDIESLISADIRMADQALKRLCEAKLIEVVNDRVRIIVND